MNHDFYSDIDWQDLIDKKIEPPFIPEIRQSDDTKYIEEHFLS